MKSLTRSYVWWPGARPVYQEMCSVLPTLPGVPSGSSLDFCPSLEIHPYSMVQATPQLHWTIPGANIPNCHGLSYKVDGSYSAVHYFAMRGWLDTLGKVNGTAFTLGKFQKFTMRYGIWIIRLASFHPTTNSQAKYVVCTTKDSLRKTDQGDWHFRLVRFLLAQHMTPCASTGSSPVELLIWHKLTTLLDGLRPDRAPEQKPRAETQSRNSTAETPGQKHQGSTQRLLP